MNTLRTGLLACSDDRSVLWRSAPLIGGAQGVLIGVRHGAGDERCSPIGIPTRCCCACMARVQIDAAQAP